MSNCKKLKDMIYDKKNLSYIMEAHNGLSAKIAKEAGFQAIWASGLSMSASEGVRDNNELSFTEVAKRCEVICSAVPDIPVLLDFDSGYGSFNTAVVALKHMIRAGIAGLVIEDKKFPKLRNSLHDNSEDDELADVEEHSLKISALKDEADKNDKDFVIVARLESFLAGKGLDDAIYRAKRYVDSGADAILVHSKKSTSEEIDIFMDAWRESEYNDIPVIIVPTKYYNTPTSHFEEIGISTIIWANHQMRASISAMQSVTKSIFNNKSLVEIEDKIASVKEVFRLQDNKDLEEREKIYMPHHNDDLSVVILAATRGNDSLYPLTKDYPKCMIPIGRGDSPLERHIKEFKKRGINNISVVAGYKYEVVKELTDSLGVECINNIQYDNPKFTELLSFHSYIDISDKKFNNVIVVYGDCIYESSIYDKIIVNSRNNDHMTFAYTNYENKDEIKSGGYFAGVIIFSRNEALNLASDLNNINYLNFLKIINESTDSCKFSIAKDSMIDLNDIEDFNKDITLY